jgi:hypothetical protein
MKRHSFLIRNSEEKNVDATAVLKFALVRADALCAMTLANDIETALDWGTCTADLDSVFAEQPRESAYQSCLALIHRERTDFQAAIAEIDDEKDLALWVTLRFLEQKSKWIQWNLVLNYRVQNQSEIDQEFAFRASALSMILARIQPLLDPISLNWIDDVLSQPIR